MKLRAIVFAVVSLALGCGDDGHEPTAYSNFQLCFDAHQDDEALSPVDAILSCCVEHPVTDLRPACGATAPDCINYLTANLSQTSASTVETQEACAAYEDGL